LANRSFSSVGGQPHDLLSKNVDGELSAEEAKELDLLLTQVDELNLVKARAAATLHRIEN
jgi:anti-sigma factor RsiW